MTNKLSRKNAAAMWDELRGHFVNAEQGIKAIIEQEAWLPLGYGSFAEAWADRMQGVPLATDAVRAHVVYALIDTGLTNEDVLDATGIGSRIGPETVETLRRQKAAGVPADLASTRVRAHMRSKPRAPHMVHAELNTDEYEMFKELAASMGMEVGGLASQLIRTYIESGEIAA